MGGQSRRMGELGGATNKLTKQSIDFAQKCSIGTSRAIGAIEVLKCREQSLRNIASAVRTESSRSIRDH